MNNTKIKTEYTSASMLIGKHEWRLLIVFDEWFENYFVEYEWRRKGNVHFLPKKEWPRYDFNHHNFGLPVTLKQLYNANLDIIRRFKPNANKAT